MMHRFVAALLVIAGCEKTLPDVVENATPSPNASILPAPLSSLGQPAAETPPTARHAADLGLLPVVVTDACGVVEPQAAERSLASLDYSMLCYRASAEETQHALSGS